MVAWKTVFLAAMVIAFVDALWQGITGGGILLQGDKYSFIQLIMLFIRVIVTFLALILHAITHLNQLPQDLDLLIKGFLAILWFIVGSIIDLLLHFIRLPFELIGSWTTTFGFYIDLWAFGYIIIDFRSLSIVVTVPNIDTDLAGVYIVCKNTIGFSLLGASDLTPSLYSLSVTNLTGLGETVTKSLPSGLNEFISIDFNMEDYIWTKPLLAPKILIGLENVGVSASLEGLFRLIVDGLGIPKLAEWTDSTLITLGVIQPNISQIYYYINVNAEKVRFNCQKIIV